MVNMTPSDLLTLTRTCWGEARGEGKEGVAAVVHVILNRVAAKTWYGRSITEVCTKPWQFSCWNEGDPNLYKILDLGFGEKKFRKTTIHVLQGLNGKDPTNGATHYHNDKVEPTWAQGLAPSAIIGHHLFYKDVD